MAASIAVVVLFAAMLPWLLGVAVQFFIGSGTYVHEPLHVFLEVSGSAISISVALLLLLRVQHERGFSHLLWMITALLAMGIMDALHAFSEFGVAWSWLRHIATFSGGVLFAAVWLPVPVALTRYPRTYAMAVALLAYLLGLVIWFYPGVLPSPFLPGGYSVAVRTANMLGGVGFLVSSLFFMRRFVRQRRREDLIFASHTLLFATAGLLFGFSHLWAADWWMWHVLRLIAYVIIGVAAYQLVGRTFAQISKEAQELESRVVERTRQVTAGDQRFTDILASIQDGVMVLDPQYRISFLNQPGRDILAGRGVDLTPLLGKVLFEAFPETRATVVEREFTRAMGERTPVEFENYYVPHHVWYLVRAFPMRDGGLSVFFQDITSRKRGLEALRESEERFRVLAENIAQLAWMTDDSGAVTWFNKRWFEYTGMTLEDIRGWGWQKVHHPEQAEWVTTSWKRALAEGRDWEETFLLRAADGQYRWFLARAVPIRNESGKITRWFGTNTDITEQRHVEEQLRRQEQQLLLITDAMPALVSYIDDGGRYRFANRVYEIWFGRPRDQVVGRTMDEVLGEAAARQVAPYLKRALAGEDVRFETEVNYRGIGRRWIDAHYVPHRSNERVIGVFVLVLDMTERKRTEEALRNQARLLNLSNDGIIVCDMEDRITYWNHGAEEIYGWKSDEALGRKKYELLQSRYPAPRDEIVAALIRDHRWAGEVVQRRRDGTIITVITRWALDRNERGEAVAVLKSDNDISQRKQAETALAEAKAQLEAANRDLDRIVQQRTAELRDTIGQLETFSYSITHDMRGPLRAMNSFAQLLAEDYSDKLDTAGRDYIKRIMDAARRLDHLIQDVLQYSRMSREKLTLEPVSLEALLRDIVHQYPDLARHRGCIHLQPNCRDLYVTANVAALTQVVSNLLTNAIKFVTAGVVPDVQIYCERVDEGRMVRLNVHDNGIGIPPEHLDRIFGIFERLHGAEYPGTGIGLSIVKKAVERMGGRIGVESLPGNGSRFWVDLPAAAKPLTPVAAAST